MSHSVHFDPTIILFREKYLKVSGKIIMRIFMISAAYLKLLFSLLNSNQRENLILKNRYVSDEYDIVIF